MFLFCDLCVLEKTQMREREEKFVNKLTEGWVEAPLFSLWTPYFPLPLETDTLLHLTRVVMIRTVLSVFPPSFIYARVACAAPKRVISVKAPSFSNRQETTKT